MVHWNGVKFLKDIMHEFSNQNNGGALASKWVNNIMEIMPHRQSFLCGRPVLLGFASPTVQQRQEVLQISQQQEEVSNSERLNPGFGEEYSDRRIMREDIQYLPEKINLGATQFSDMIFCTVWRNFASIDEVAVHSGHFQVPLGRWDLRIQAKWDDLSKGKQQEVSNLKRHKPDFGAEYREDGTRINIRYLPDKVNLKRKHFLDVKMCTAGRNLASTDEFTAHAIHPKCKGNQNKSQQASEVWSQTRSVLLTLRFKFEIVNLCNSALGSPVSTSTRRGPRGGSGGRGQKSEKEHPPELEETPSVCLKILSREMPKNKGDNRWIGAVQIG
ncbi:hypothetical protein B0H11DRAFT_1919141 [Mycena galericulata]|nr:hypothetical protein B0H11DRAFT_1919141 [Mycena galericulata]